MAVRTVERKLTAILAADGAGYSRLMGADEVGTLQHLTACRVIVDGLIAAHRGRIFNTAGDSVVADFASAVDAVECGDRGAGGAGRRERATPNSASCSCPACAWRWARQNALLYDTELRRAKTPRAAHFSREPRA
jgi:class 3 adenylate cyclase